MLSLSVIAVAIFIAGYLFITLEHTVKTHKSGIALLMAALLWTTVAFSGLNSNTITELLNHAGAEIFGLITFLLAAMTLVEVLIHYRFFDVVRAKITQLGLGDRGQFFLIAALTFFFSAVLDNLTVTIIMVQIARRFFAEERLLIAVTGIVILANAGGAWSPIGDVTTIMLWLADKFSAIQIISWGFLPSLAMGLVATFLIGNHLSKNRGGNEKCEEVRLCAPEKTVITLAFGSFTLPVIFHLAHLPPYLGLLFGLGVTWLFIEYFKHHSKQDFETKQTNLERLVQKTDIASIKFFIGILLSVSALGALGLLDALSLLVFGEAPSIMRLGIGSSVMGLLSAIVDNVPLTALAIDLIHIENPALWALTAVTVGTGGSLLLVGSVAGVIAAGMVPELTFGKYARYAFTPVLVGYFLAIAVWVGQYALFTPEYVEASPHTPQQEMVESH
ncbi:MAG: sodium:proton antiporter NhaD [Patescibacteria group bacterium UBA2103]